MRRETIYYCIFSFRGGEYTVHGAHGIFDFTNGFWVNKDMKYTQGADCKFWIPESKIHYIVKETYEVNDG